MNSKEAVRPVKGDTRWEDWEIGSLIGLAIDGKSYEVIGASLGRTGAACVRMLNRLLDGETPCPQVYLYLLEDGRRRFGRKGLPMVYPSSVLSAIADLESGIRLILAVDVLAGNLDAEEIRKNCSEPLATRIMATVEELRNDRRLAFIFQSPKPPADAPVVFSEGGHPMGGEAAEEAPLVVVGQGGSQRSIYPKDLQNEVH